MSRASPCRPSADVVGNCSSVVRLTSGGYLVATVVTRRIIRWATTPARSACAGGRAATPPAPPCYSPGPGRASCSQPCRSGSGRLRRALAPPGSSAMTHRTLALRLSAIAGPSHESSRTTTHWPMAGTGAVRSDFALSLSLRMITKMSVWLRFTAPLSHQGACPSGLGSNRPHPPTENAVEAGR